MNSSGPQDGSPVRGTSSQYIPSLFATHVQSGVGAGSSRGGVYDDVDALEKYSRMSFEHPQHPRDEHSSAAARDATGTSAVGNARSLRFESGGPSVTGGPSGSNPVAPPGVSPSPTSTIDYADIEQKQTELRSAVEYRIHSLERTLAMRDEELVRLRAQLRKMEEDYQFNYNLIGDRDAAIEEAAQQLQRLYREMKRVTNEAGVMEKKLLAAETEVSDLKKRARDAEAARESTVAQVKKEYAIKEQHLLQTVKAKEAALEDERQKAHEEYMKMMKELEETKAETEGRTANVSSQLEQRHQQVVQRLQTEMERVQKRLEVAETERSAAEATANKLQEKNATLQHQLDVEAQRHSVALEEVKEANQKLDAQLAQTTSLLNKSLATAEDAIREETQKSSRLELENTSLQSRLAETKAQLQEAQRRLIEDTRSFAEERRAMQANYQSALAAMEETEKKSRGAERALRDSVAEKTEEVAKLSRQLQEAQRELQLEKATREESKSEMAKLQQEVDRLTAEVQRWKDEEAKTAASARHEKGLAEEKLLALERAAQEARDESERQRRKAFDLQERNQAEVARLTRELHASEAARRVVEDQFHLSQQRDGQSVLINGLRFEKEALEKRVAQLDRANAEIREQVAKFTLELQNDPMVTAAKETQRRVQELQQELLAARDEAQRLRDALREKEEEVSRYQVDILRAQMLLGADGSVSSPDGGPGADFLASLGRRDGTSAGRGPTLSGSAAELMRQQHDLMRSEWVALRDRFAKDAVDSVNARKAKGRRHRAASSSSSSSTPRSRSSSSSSSNSGGGSDTASSRRSSRDAVKGRRRRLSKHHRRLHSKRGDRRRVAVAGLPATASAAADRASLPPPLPAGSSRVATAEEEGKAVRNSFLLQEAEVWRQKSLQLEQQLRAVLRERDQLRRELGLAKQDVAALSSEKQSLLDLNSLLKAQLREAYRTSYESFAHTTHVSAANGGGTANSVGKEDRGGPGLPPPEWVAAAAAAAIAAQQQQQQQQRETSQRPPRHPQSGSSPAAVAASSARPSRGAYAPHEASQARKSGISGSPANPPRNYNAGLNTSSFSSNATPISHSSSAAAVSGGVPSSSPGFRQQLEQRQRLAELEEEIAHVRGQINSTTSAAKKQQQRETDGAPVHRKGGAAVRHYGYQ